MSSSNSEDDSTDGQLLFLHLENAPENDSEGAFIDHYMSFMKSIGRGKIPVPTVGHVRLDVFKFYKEVQKRGGIDKVIENKQWRPISRILGIPSTATSASFALKQAYMRMLYQYELRFVRNVTNYDELRKPKGVEIKRSKRGRGRSLWSLTEEKKKSKKARLQLSEQAAVAKIVSSVQEDRPCLIESNFVVDIDGAYDIKLITMQIQSGVPTELVRGMNNLLELSSSSNCPISLVSKSGANLLRVLIEILRKCGKDVQKSEETALHKTFPGDFGEILPWAGNESSIACLLSVLLVLSNIVHDRVNCEVIATDFHTIEALVALLEESRNLSKPLGEELAIYVLEILGGAFARVVVCESKAIRALTLFTWQILSSKDQSRSRRLLYAATRLLRYLLEREDRVKLPLGQNKEFQRQAVRNLLKSLSRCDDLQETMDVLVQLEIITGMCSNLHCACDYGGGAGSNSADVLGFVLEEMATKDFSKRRLWEEMKTQILQYTLKVVSIVAKDCTNCLRRFKYAFTQRAALSITTQAVQIPEEIRCIFAP